MSRVLETLVLSGEDAINFANSLLRPSLTDIQKRQEFIEKINDGVSIVRKHGGFTADVVDLDLSFLDNTVEEKSFNFKTTVRVTLPDHKYNTDNGGDEYSIFACEKNDEYCEACESDYLSWAA